MSFKPFLALLGAALAAAPCAAHDFWIEPSSHRPAVGDVLEARLFIGHAGEKEAYARNPRHLVELALRGGAERRDLLGRPGDDPAGRLRLEEAGTFVLAYRSRTSSLEMEPAAFESYLREEGLEHVVDERARRGESQRPGREAYSRCAKALLRTAGASAGGHDRALGLALELVPLSDPFTHDPEHAGPFLLRVDRDGEPLAGVQVHAASLDRPSTPELRARSDAEGRVRLALPHAGRWSLCAVHMERATEEAEHDWRSYWASLTFPVGSPQLPATEGVDARKKARAE